MTPLVVLQGLNPLTTTVLVFTIVIETNPDALAVADELDSAFRNEDSLEPLHGIPILVKDNIDTGDRMLTTAGSSH